MTTFLNDFSETALVTAIEANLFEMFSALYDYLPNAVYREEADITWFMSDLSFVLFNGVMHARLAPDHLDARIQEEVANFKSANKPMIWWTGSSTRPDDLGSHLLACGLLHLDDSPGMAVDLGDLNKDILITPAVTVKRVGSPEELKQWIDPFAANFDVSQKAAQQLYESLARLGFDENGTLHHYLGLLNGDVVGTATLYLGAGVAGIYNVSTLPGARRQGVGTALTLVPLRAARDRGYQIGILHSTEMGYEIYQRIGFRTFSTISHYLYLPNRAQRAFLKLYLWGERFVKSIR